MKLMTSELAAYLASRRRCIKLTGLAQEQGFQRRSCALNSTEDFADARQEEECDDCVGRDSSSAAANAVCTRLHCQEIRDHCGDGRSIGFGALSLGDARMIVIIHRVLDDGHSIRDHGHSIRDHGHSIRDHGHSTARRAIIGDESIHCLNGNEISCKNRSLRRLCMVQLILLTEHLSGSRRH